MNDYCKITAPYSRLSVGDEDSIQKVLSSDNTWACLIFILSVGYGKILGTLGKEELFSGGG